MTRVFPRLDFTLDLTLANFGLLSKCCSRRGGGGPTPFLYMATRFLPNVHVQKCTKYVFSCLEVLWIDLLAVANLQ